MTHYDTATAQALGLELRALERGPEREMLPGARPGLPAISILPKLRLSISLPALFEAKKPLRPF